MKSMENILQSYFNSNDYDLVNRVWVDYDDTFDRYNINVFFNKKEFIKLESSQNGHIRKVFNEIRSELNGYFKNVRTALYTHFE